MPVLLTPPNLQFFDTSGQPLAFGKVYTYAATGGTFSTPKATYTDATGSTEAPNPVILDAGGFPATGLGGIWLNGSYDFKICDSDDVQIKTQLAVTAFTALPAATDSFFESLSGNGTQTAFTVSEDLGTDENAIYVWVDNSNRDYVTNGTFATDTGWTKGAGWTIGAGVATATGAISTAISQTAPFTITEGRSYTVTFTITRSAGTLTPSIGGTSGTAQNASGTYSETIIAGSTQTIAFTGSGFTGTLDNVTIETANGAGFDIQPPVNYTINGTSLTFTLPPANGTNNILVSAPSLLVGAASSAAADAAASATAALASEQQAGVYAGQLTIVSTSSVAIGTGTKTFTVSTGLSLNAGQFLLIASDAAPTTNYMWGQITSYSGSTLQVNVTVDVGSGTYADWTMYLTGERGATGATGSVTDANDITAGTSAGINLQNVGGTTVLNIGAGGGVSATLSGNLSMNTSNKIVNMADPSSAQDAATKNYVDSRSVNNALVATTSGTEVELITGLPTTVKKIILSFVGVSLSGTENILVQLGDSGGYYTSGYTSIFNNSGSSTVGSSAAGFSFGDANAASLWRGHVILTKADSASDLWVASSVMSSATNLSNMAGSINLSNPLEDIRVKSSGTNTFDAGSINVQYE